MKEADQRTAKENGGSKFFMFHDNKRQLGFGFMRH